jgi:CDP-diglyceride synthetase
MDCSIAILKLLLMVFNLVFFLVNLIMTILFAWKVTYPVSQGDMALSVLVIQLSLVGLTILFAFGLWVTIKRKFLLLKLFSIVLGIFIAAQVCVEAGNHAPRICSESPPHTTTQVPTVLFACTDGRRRLATRWAREGDLL